VTEEEDQADASFEAWVVSRFGREPYDVYFRPHTEKVCGVKCEELASDHAVHRIRVPSMAAAVKGSLLRHTAKRGTLVSRFLYPPPGFDVIVPLIPIIRGHGVQHGNILSET
jgi:protoporphyrinogen oxidase